MNYFSIIGGLICIIIVALVFPMANNRIKKGELNHLTIKGYLLSILLVCLGIYFIAKELAKII